MEVKGKECRFVVHIPSRKGSDDYHLIKEQIHYSDGTIKPNLKVIKNYKRKFWVTKPKYRNHKQKKEWEKIDNLLEVETTESNMRDAVAKQLGKQWCNDTLKQLTVSPYIYGTDVTSGSLIKKEYKNQYPNLVSPFTTAMFDVETDVVKGHKEIIIASLVMKDKLFISIDKEFVKGFANVKEAIISKADKYIGEYIRKYNMSIDIHIADNSLDIVKAIFAKAHEWKPDFLVIWNINFDIKRVLETLDRYDVDPRDVLCDPSIPKQYRICRYKEGPDKKITSSGKMTPISWESRWHTLFCTSSFYVIDAACAYKYIRLSKQAEASYSLDSILDKELGIRKLSFKEADNYTDLAKHIFMQTNYKLEYIVYNMFDCISMIELDEKTKDLQSTLPDSSDTSEFFKFSSQPKRIADAFYYFAKDKGYILGSTGYDKPKFEDIEIVNDPSNDDDDKEDLTLGLGLKNWICTLPSHMSSLGLKLIAEDSTIQTCIRAFTYDSDAAAAYPNATSVCNVSKETTKRELISIQDIEEDVFRAQNLNLILGSVNAIEYSTTMFNMPKPHELLNIIN